MKSLRHIFEASCRTEVKINPNKQNRNESARVSCVSREQKIMTWAWQSSAKTDLPRTFLCVCFCFGGIVSFVVMVSIFILIQSLPCVWLIKRGEERSSATYTTELTDAQQGCVHVCRCVLLQVARLVCLSTSVSWYVSVCCVCMIVCVVCLSSVYALTYLLNIDPSLLPQPATP